MNLLIIDTSCDALTIALEADGKLYPYKSEAARKGHSVMLLGAVDSLLKESGLRLKDIDYFGAVAGPGSFTGVRVGVATVNAFAYSCKKPAVAVTAFEAFAYNGDRKMIYAIDAKHGNYYLAKFNASGELIYRTAEGEKLPEKSVLLNVTEVTPESLISVMKQKIEAKAYKAVIQPVYMRESEAERNRK